MRAIARRLTRLETKVHADDPAARTHVLLQEREIESCSAAEIDHRIALAESERLDCPFAISPMAEPGEVVEQRTPVVSVGPSCDRARLA